MFPPLHIFDYTLSMELSALNFILTAFAGASAEYPIVVDHPFTHSLLKLDIDPRVIETERGVSLAIIDQG